MLIHEQVALFLDSQNVGTYDVDGDTGDIYINTLPDTIDNVVSIFLRGGGTRDPKGTDYSYSIASVQVIVRNRSKHAGLEKASQILNLLHGHTGTLTSGGNSILDITSLQGEPADIGMDEATRHEWSINIDVEYKI